MRSLKFSNYDPSAFPAPTMISVNEVELEVYEAGDPSSNNPIVLCHGFPEHAFSWRYQISALVDAGYHVIIPNQRGYGGSSRPTRITQYDILHLTGDLVGLLDHFGYEKAIFVGHDWGANVVWRLAQLHPDRVSKLINLALPYQVRGDRPWIEFMEEVFGEDFYFVHFNRQYGVADDIMEAHTAQFLGNLFRKNLPALTPTPGMMMINLARADQALGDPIMSESELSVYIDSFESSGFTGSINWYRNLDRNWHILADANPIIEHPTLMIYGERDIIPPFAELPHFVPNVEVVSIDCGHCIQQERPRETNETILNWL